MALLSSLNLLLLSPTPFITPKPHKPHLFSPPQLKPFSISSSLSTSTPTTITTTPWTQFSSTISGEWDGFCADFTPTGAPIELPYNVTPAAFRDWDVKLFDWQTQCPTLATPHPQLSYKLIKLLPTVGCEADAATKHTVELRTAGGPNNTVERFGYDRSGCYVAVWRTEKGLELEHCFVDRRNREIRVRVVVKVGVGLVLEGVTVYSEQWYGEWRDGEQLGGCAVRESGFAESGRLEVGEVVGSWEGSAGVAAVGSGEGQDIFHEFVVDKPQKSIRDQVGLVTLPKNLWCSLKEKGGETWGEVGWLLDHGCAMTSRCVFHEDGRLKEMAIGQETAVLKDE